MRSLKGARRLIAAGVLIEAALFGLFLCDSPRANIPVFFLCYTTAFLAYVVAIGARSSVSLRTVVLFGVLFRLTVLMVPPSLSDDIHRYVWDGSVQNLGINPYLYAPDDVPEDKASRIGVGRDRINHSHLHTIYPPVAQLFFRLATYSHASAWSVKVGILLADFFAAWFIVGLLRVFDLDQRSVLLYFWNPLLLVEGGIEGHIDVVGAAFVVLALLYGQVSGPGRAAFALAFAALTKLVPVAVLPVLWRWSTAGEDAGVMGRVRAMLRPRGWIVPGIFLIVCGAFYGAYSKPGVGLLGSFTTYVVDWEFNGLLFGVLRDLMGHGHVVRLLLGGVFVLVVIGVTLSGLPALAGMFTLFLVFLFLTPTLHPWYALWIVPFLPFYPYKPAIALTGSIASAHHVLISYEATGVWAESPWIPWFVWGLPASIAGWSFLRQRRKKRAYF
jgi:hypothetical protein